MPAARCTQQLSAPGEDDCPAVRNHFGQLHKEQRVVERRQRLHRLRLIVVHVTNNPNRPTVEAPIATLAPAATEGVPTLNRLQHELFRSQGFVVVPGLVERRLLQAAMQHIWMHAPAPLLRDDTSTWESPHRHWTASRHPKYVEQPYFLSPDGPSYRLYKGNDSHLALNLLPRHPNVASIVTELLGEPARPPRKIRGFYTIFPVKSDSARSGAGFSTQQNPEAVASDMAQQVGNSMHVDGAAAQLSACLYLSDVATGGGGLTVIAGSHLELNSEFTSEFNYEPKPSFAAKLASLTTTACARHSTASLRVAGDASTTGDVTGQMVEVTAPAGSVIFFHSRLAHAAGVNTIHGTARMAVFCDFQKERPAVVDVPPVDGTSFRRLRTEEPNWRPGLPHARSQHWVDTREQVNDRPPPSGDDMWCNWGDLPKF